jgi:ankyrin repeat protein
MPLGRLLRYLAAGLALALVASLSRSFYLTQHRQALGYELIDAVRDQDTAHVQALLMQGAPVDFVYHDFKRRHFGPPLVIAAKMGSVEIVESLLAHRARVNDLDNAALITASWQGHADVVTRLLEAGAAINQPDQAGETALIAATMKKQREVVIVLLAHHADVNLRVGSGWSALKYALQNKDQATAQLLEQTGAKLSFAEAVVLGKIALAKRLPHTRADVNAEIEDGSRLLIKTTLNGPTSSVHFLLEQGADVNIKADDGYTALMGAASQGNATVVRLLLAHGARVNETEQWNKMTALHIAAKSAKIIPMLVEHGANVNARDEHGRTPVFYAALEENIPAVRTLIAAGADVNAVDDVGETILHIAASDINSHGSQVTVKLLKDAGAKK